MDSRDASASKNCTFLARWLPLSASIFVRCTKNTGHLGNHVGSLLSTESAGSTLSRIFSKSPNSSSLAELKLQPRMVEGAKKMVSERTFKLNGTISSSLDQGSFSITHRFWSGIDEYLLEVTIVVRNRPFKAHHMTHSQMLGKVEYGLPAKI